MEKNKVPFEDKEIVLLREKFIVEYSKKMGWNYKELSPNQILEIVNHKEYQHPGLLLG